MFSQKNGEALRCMRCFHASRSLLFCRGNPQRRLFTPGAGMDVFKQLILILISNVVALDAVCPKGSKVVPGKNRRHTCILCSQGYYQPVANDSQECSLCTQCDNDNGSEIKQNCTRETNTICRCRDGFVAWNSDNSYCHCGVGFGLSQSNPSLLPACSECEEGYFNTAINAPCKKWTSCPSSKVKVNGTATSDVICHDVQEGHSGIAVTPTGNKSVSPKSLSTQRPHEGAQTENMMTVHTTAGTLRQTTRKEKVQPSQPSNTGWTFVILGIAALLVLLTGVTCKMHISPYWQRRKTAGLQANDSTCRRPVEESGDGSELSLKQNAEEP